MSNKKFKITMLVIRLLIGGLFLISGVGKLLESGDAQNLVELMATEYYWLIEYKSLIVIMTSITELLLGALLLWGRYLKTALAGSTLLIISFTGVLGYFWLQGQEVASCGCFGAFGFESGIEFTLIRNIVLLALIAAGFYLTMRPGERSVIT